MSPADRSYLTPRLPCSSFQHWVDLPFDAPLPSYSVLFFRNKTHLVLFVLRVVVSLAPTGPVSLGVVVGTLWLSRGPCRRRNGFPFVYTNDPNGTEIPSPGEELCSVCTSLGPKRLSPRFGRPALDHYNLHPRPVLLDGTGYLTKTRVPEKERTVPRPWSLPLTPPQRPTYLTGASTVHGSRRRDSGGVHQLPPEVTGEGPRVVSITPIPSFLQRGFPRRRLGE